LKNALLACLALIVLGCDKNETYIPPPPTYFLLIPESHAIWAKHIEKGFLAGCEQLQMECKVSHYKMTTPAALARAAVDLGDPKDAPICIVFQKPSDVSDTCDLLSLEDRQAITIGADDSNAFRLGHVGVDAKKLAAQVAARAAGMKPKATRLLYLFGDALIDFKAAEAAAFRESAEWSRYRLRTKLLSEVTEEDFQWADLVIAFGEDALSKAAKSASERIVPVDPSDAALDRLNSGRAPIIIGANYFDIGFRASRIAREQFLNGRIARPILPIAPKEVDKESLDWYLEKRFEIPAIKPSPPAKKKS
jgi:hypothetical protein